GDPDFRLDEGAELRAPEGRVAHEELIDLLERMREQARVPDEAPSEDLAVTRLAQLDRLVEETPSAWLGRSDVLMTLGHAYGEWAALEKAMQYINAALDTGELDNRTTLKAVEQLANFEARLAMREVAAEGPPAERRAAAQQRIGVAINRLWGLE